VTDPDKDREIAELRARLDAITPARTKKRGGCLPVLGVLAVLMLVVIVIGSTLQHSGGDQAGSSTPAGPVDAEQQAKDAGAEDARLLVPRFMKDPSSAQFGRVWGVGTHSACGFVDGKNSFGAKTGEQRFIFVMGAVEFEGAPGFAHHWNTFCVEKLRSAAPAGMMGKRWGSRPSSDLKSYTAPTGDGLSLYVPRGAPPPLDGVPVREADYRFDHGRLYAGDLYMNGELSRDAAKAALTKAYGKPLQSDDDAHSYKWNWPDRHVTIDMTYQESSKETQVTFAHGGY